MFGLTQPFHHRRMTAEMKADTKLWLSFLHNFNGIVHILEQTWFDNETEELYTDSAGGIQFGGACYFGGIWCFFQWPKLWTACPVMKDMTFLGMVPVLLTIFLWGHSLANKKFKMWIDNKALVDVLNKQTSKSRRVMHLVRVFVLHTMRYKYTV